MTAKPSGLPTPRPPVTMTGASSRLMMPAFSHTTSAMAVSKLPAPNWTGRGTISASAGASARANAPVRTATTAGPDVTCIRASTVPPKHGCVATRPPSAASRAVASTSRPASSRAAQAAATSRPSGEPAKSTAAGPAAWTAAAAASVNGPGRYAGELGALDRVDALRAVARGLGREWRGVGGRNEHAQPAAERRRELASARDALERDVREPVAARFGDHEDSCLFGHFSASHQTSFALVRKSAMR